MSRYLVTGGAGYVGSHVVAALLGRGDAVTVIDDLSTGHRAAVLPGARLIVADLADGAAVEAAFAAARPEAVLHFAARSLVGESMRDPLGYLADNAGNGIALIRACIRHGVGRFVLSSTAALFGAPSAAPIDEDAPIAPASPYGESKWMLERALAWAGRVHGLRYAALRYFNAAGADPAGRLGEDHDPETHLIPLAIDAALGRRPPLGIFGTDYPTPDGTCIRDYVHVSDLAEAHLLALARLEQASVTYNLGSATGHSVRAVIEAVGRAAGRPVPVEAKPRRAGDPACLIAGCARIRADTGWTPRLPSLDAIVETALAWRLAHPGGYGRAKGV